MHHVHATTVETPRLRTAIRFHGPDSGVPVVFIHGNVSSAVFWDDTLLALPPEHRGVALDLRGFGDSETKPVDATRGLRDFADDVWAAVDALGLATPLHLVGWSMGGGVAMQCTLARPAAVASLALVAPLSPYGFGGTKGLDGTPCWPDYAGSGGGTAAADFVKALREGDTGSGQFSPRTTMNAFYFKPPFRLDEATEERFVASMLTTKTGDGNYPGSLATSPHWPGVRPGETGVNNAMAPGYCDLSAFATIDPKPAVLWIRGADDQIVSDTSFFDLGFLGQVGAVPGWPGMEIYPPQPMVSQTRAVLDRYAANGGRYREEVFADCGHSPLVEKPDAFRASLFAFLGAQEPSAVAA